MTAFKHETATVVMGNLRRDMTSCEERKSRHAQVHTALFAKRRAVTKDIEVRNPFLFIILTYIHTRAIQLKLSGITTAN